FIRRLKYASKQGRFMQRLRCIFRVYAARAQEHQFLDSCRIGCAYHISLYLQILSNEVSWKRTISSNPSNLRSRQEYIVGRFPLKKIIHCALITQIHFASSCEKKVFEPLVP